MNPSLFLGTGIALLILGGTLLIFNKLIGLRIRSQEAWSGVDTQLKRRYDLIPNLVSIVKAYATHEQTTFEEVTKARIEAVQNNPISNQGSLEQNLTGALHHLFAVAEAYPELQASEQFLKLQEELSTIEQDLNHARRYYNAVVRDFNTLQAQVPFNIVAKLFGFRSDPFFTLDSTEESQSPNLDL